MGATKIEISKCNEVPNTYNLLPEDIKHIVIKDWDKLKEHTWHNSAMKNGSWWCHLEGSNGGGFYGDEDEFWIGFREDDNKVDFHFTSGEGMCHYRFKKFYNLEEIENTYDLNVQMNALRFLNMLIEKGIVALYK